MEHAKKAILHAAAVKVTLIGHNTTFSEQPLFRIDH
jgi:hypothetical protein